MKIHFYIFNWAENGEVLMGVANELLFFTGMLKGTKTSLLTIS